MWVLSARKRLTHQNPFVLPLCLSPDTISMKHSVLNVEILIPETNFAYFLWVIDGTVTQENFQNSDP